MNCNKKEILNPRDTFSCAFCVVVGCWAQRQRSVKFEYAADWDFFLTRENKVNLVFTRVATNIALID